MRLGRSALATDDGAPSGGAIVQRDHRFRLPWARAECVAPNPKGGRVPTVRDFIRQLQRLPQDVQVLIDDTENGCLVPPIIRTLDEGAVQIAAPSQLGDHTIRDRIELEKMELEMDADGEPFDEP